MWFDSNDFDTVFVLGITSLFFKSFFTSGARTNFVTVFLIFNINHYNGLKTAKWVDKETALSNNQ